MKFGTTLRNERQVHTEVDAGTVCTEADTQYIGRQQVRIPCIELTPGYLCFNEADVQSCTVLMGAGKIVILCYHWSSHIIPLCHADLATGMHTCCCQQCTGYRGQIVLARMVTLPV